jgi:hypothetical protein
MVFFFPLDVPCRGGKIGVVAAAREEALRRPARGRHAGRTVPGEPAVDRTGEAHKRFLDYPEFPHRYIGTDTALW